MSTPLIRVCAVNGTKSRVERRRARARGCRTAWPARRSSGPRASRRPATRSAPPRPARPPATPGIGTNAAAWRLPSVIVPVLSSSSTSTSPDASTARPDSASTLRRTSRSMPAMPIALSSAPIVVGMSATSSAISTVIEMSVPAYSPNGRSVTTTTRNTIVRPASRIESAISFGVLRRDGALDERDHPVDERLAGLLRDLDHDAVREHARAAGDRAAVAAGLADDRRRLAGDRRLVDGGDALDHGAVAGDQLAGLDDDDVAAGQLGRGLGAAVAQPRGGLLAHRAQRRRLRLAAALGDRLGEVAEEHGQPQPDRDGEARTSRAGRSRRRST